MGDDTRKYGRFSRYMGVVMLCMLAACARQKISPVPTPVPTDGTAQAEANPPSAPLDTALCGVALREQAATGAALFDKGLKSGNNCTKNACFQPLTGTYIAQSGMNNVCR